jgi:hypothetical protein
MAAEKGIFKSALAVLTTMVIGACFLKGAGHMPQSDGGTVQTGPHPEDRVMAIGITDNSGSVPQGAPALHLVFSGGVMPGPNTIAALRVEEPPTLDGDSTEWQKIPPSIVPLLPRGAPVGFNKEQWDTEWIRRGTNPPPTYDFSKYSDGGTNGFATAVTVRAAFDDERVYFLLQWNDPTQNRFRGEFTFNGTNFVQTSGKNEDRAYMAFDINNSTPGFQAVGCAAACHLHERLDEDPTITEVRNYRFLMHTRSPEERVDVWSWRATTTNPMKKAEDSYWDNTRRMIDGPDDFVITNDGGMGLPKYMSANGVNANDDYIYLDAGTPETTAFDATGAVDGSRIPGYAHKGGGAARGDVDAVGKWNNGVWTVEFSRALVTEDPNDTSFEIK